MTIEKLAGMTQRGLRDVETRLTERMDTMEKKIDALEEKVEDVRVIVNAVLRVVENIEGRTGEMLTATRVDIPDLRKRVEELEANR